jgi:hypothetical protein
LLSPRLSSDTLLFGRATNVWAVGTSADESSAIDYHNLMLDRLDEVPDERVKALGEIERDKLRVAKAYNKRVK